MEKRELKYSNARILIIDDDITNNLLMENILTNYGYKQIKSITDPRKASDVYLEFKPELILLDMEMPYINGLDVFSKLQRLNKEEFLPTVMITAKDDHESKISALKHGIQHFIVKPFNKTELLARLHNILKIISINNDKNEKYKSIEEKLVQEKKQVIRLESSIINGLLMSVKFRNHETGEHINRVSNLVYILARGMGLSNKLSLVYAKASKLHDIGKISIPDNILLKEGTLNYEEWNIMKNHTLIGANILSAFKSEMMMIATTIAKNHHENWDGSGYPFGLVGNQIPIAGRLTSVADVFDALISHRPYKEIWDIDKAINYVKEESSKKFDPEIINVFLNNIMDIMKLYN